MIEVQCLNCQKKILRQPSQIPDSGNNFCSRSCSAKSNNQRRKIPIFCVFCGKELPARGRQRRYCNHQCQILWQDNIRVKLWLDGKSNGLTKNGTVSPYVKKYLIRKRGNKCEKCGWAEINPSTGKVPIEANHIDGNWKNNTEKNIELICPNCHSLTTTYRSLNRGNGRSQRNQPTQTSE